MKHLRLLLLPFASALEILLMAYCWIAGQASPNHALIVWRWVVDNLPDIHWYTGRNP